MSYKFEARFASQFSIDMNEQKYNLQDINAYLLGSLNETEAERFDELSFTDDEFSDVLKSAENDLIDAYVQGELGGAALKNFESHYLISPLRREKVEFAKAFQLYAEPYAAKNTANQTIEESKSKRRFAGFFSGLNILKLNPVLQSGFAAALLFVVLGGFWIAFNRFNQPESELLATQSTPTPRVEELPEAIENKESENPPAEKQIAKTSEENKSPTKNSQTENEKTTSATEPLRAPKRDNPSTSLKPIIASFVLTPSLRGNNQIKSLSIPKETSRILMKLELEPNDFSAYRVVLVNQSNNKNIWRSNLLKLKSKGGDKLLDVNFPAALLKPQIYSLQVSGISADGTVEIIGDYPFRIVR